MNGMYDPKRDGHALDKLRHTDPKTARTMKRAGGRFQQYAAVAAKGAVMGGAAGTGTTGIRRLAMDATPEIWQRYTAARGERTNHQTMKALLDAYEQRPVLVRTDSPGPDFDRAAWELLCAMQNRLKLPTPMAAVERYIELYEVSDKRAARIMKLESQIALFTESTVAMEQELDAMRRSPRMVNGELAKMFKEWAVKLGTNGYVPTLKKLGEQADSVVTMLRKAEELTEAVGRQQERIDQQDREYQELNTAYREMTNARNAVVTTASTALNATGSTSKPNVESVLFEFVSAFAGATMTADASGSMNVQLPDTTPFFAIWQRAVTALGFGKYVV